MTLRLIEQACGCCTVQGGGVLEGACSSLPFTLVPMPGHMMLRWASRWPLPPGMHTVRAAAAVDACGSLGAQGPVSSG